MTKYLIRCYMALLYTVIINESNIVTSCQKWTYHCGLFFDFINCVRMIHQILLQNLCSLTINGCYIYLIFFYFTLWIANCALNLIKSYCFLFVFIRISITNKSIPFLFLKLLLRTFLNTIYFGINKCTW